MSKAANHEGSIKKYFVKGVQKGWRAIIIMVGTTEEGKPIKKQFYGKSQKEAKHKLDQYKHNVMYIPYIPNNSITFQEWFKSWLFDFKKN